MNHRSCFPLPSRPLPFAPCHMLLALLLFWPAAGLVAQTPAAEEGRTRFCTVDIIVDSQTTPLAAYQLQFAVTNTNAKIVGIEGGDHPAFREPPFYDPKAIQQQRVVIAAFSLHTDLPQGPTRVATIHLQVNGTWTPLFELNLQAAGDPQGNRIHAQARCHERQTP